MDDPIPQSFRPFGPGIVTLPERMRREYGAHLLEYINLKINSQPTEALVDFSRGIKFFTARSGIYEIPVNSRNDEKIRYIEDFVFENSEDNKNEIVSGIKALGQGIYGDLMNTFFFKKFKCREGVAIPSVLPLWAHLYINISGKIYSLYMQFDFVVNITTNSSNDIVVLGEDGRLVDFELDKLSDIRSKFAKISLKPFPLQLNKNREPDLLQIINQYYQWIGTQTELKPLAVTAECYELDEKDGKLALEMKDIKIGIYTDELQTSSKFYNDIILQKTPKDIFFEACQRDNYNRRQSLSPFFSSPKPVSSSFWDRFRWSSSNKNNKEDKAAKQSRIDREYGIQRAQRNTPRIVR